MENKRAPSWHFPRHGNETLHLSLPILRHVLPISPKYKTEKAENADKRREEDEQLKQQENKRKQREKMKGRSIRRSTLLVHDGR